MDSFCEKIKPIFLLADSQLLFYNNENCLFLNTIKKYIPGDNNKISAAYIGSSNNDNLQYYEIFVAAMQQLGIENCRMIKSIPTAEDNEFLEKADIILLAGGDTYKGWNIIKSNNWNKIISEEYSKGTILIGVSAGAVQLGLKGYQNNTEENKKEPGFDTLKLVPFIIDVHANDDWLNLSKYVKLENRYLKGYGIPFGAGIIYYPDKSIEPVRYACTEIVIKDEVVVKSIILPHDKQKELNIG